MPNEVKLLPCEPTPKMASAGMHIIAALPADTGWPELARAACDVYRAMAKAAPTTVVTDEVVERAYEEGVEDGIAWHCYPESGPRPQWINSELRKAIAAMPTVVTGEQPEDLGDYALPPSGLSRYRKFNQGEVK